MNNNIINYKDSNEYTELFKAVKTYGEALQYVPIELRDKEICL